jgi:hypothetical protein
MCTGGREVAAGITLTENLQIGKLLAQIGNYITVNQHSGNRGLV